LAQAVKFCFVFGKQGLGCFVLSLICRLVCLLFGGLVFVSLFAPFFRLVSRLIGQFIRFKFTSILWFDPLSKILAINNSRQSTA